jgi:hypothetical protein
MERGSANARFQRVLCGMMRRSGRWRFTPLLPGTLPRVMPALLLAAALISLPVPAAAQASPPAEAAASLERANASLAAGDLEGAASAFEAIARGDPANGAAWLGLGQAFHGREMFPEAIAALEKAESLGFAPGQTRYGLARAAARLGRVNVALTWLDRAVDAGFQALRPLQIETDLDGLRDDPRFAAIVERVERAASPCRFEPEYSRFDFWLGEWEVRYPDGRIAGTNSIRKAADGCLLLESWSGAGGGSGNSINFYDPATGKWVQTWVDSSGDVISAEGGFRDGAMRLLGTHILKSGERRPFRMTFTPLPNGHVRQLLEEATGGPESWSVWFDGDYAPAPTSR